MAPAAPLAASMELLPPGTNFNLTAEGRVDWAHWGLFIETTFIRKFGVSQQIYYTDLVKNAFDGPYAPLRGPNGFSWSDGTPWLAMSNTAQGIFYVGLSNGVEITCPADQALKTLRLYVGAGAGRARFTASLSGSGATGYTNTTYASQDGSSNALFTVSFQAASAGQTLTVDYTLEEELVAGQGSVALFAATLNSAVAPPAVEITAPTNQAAFIAPAGFQVTASADSTAAITDLEIFRGATRIARAATNLLTQAESGLGTNVYSFTARATDNGGLSATSLPVTVFVTTGAGLLAGRLSAPSSNVDLTVEGPLDWAHWGLTNPASLDRKAGVPRAISDVTPVGVHANKIEQYQDNYSGFFWTDGAPTLSATNSHTGIFVWGVNTGFEMSVPVSPTPRRLKLYVGLYGAQAELDAWLDDFSGPAFTDTSVAVPYGNAYALYTLDFASTNSRASLVVRWTGIALFDLQYGNVTWQAATLAPVPVLTRPTLVVDPASAGQFGLSLPTQVGLTYTVWCTDTLSAPAWQVLTNFAGNGASQTFMEPMADRPSRFYRVQVE